MKTIYYPRSYLHVLEQPCSTCIFNLATSPLDGKEGLERQLAKCQKLGTYQECHHASVAGEQVMCRGFWNWAKKTRNEPVAMQVGERLGLVVEVPQADLDALADLKREKRWQKRKT